LILRNFEAFNIEASKIRISKQIANHTSKDQSQDLFKIISVLYSTQNIIHIHMLEITESVKITIICDFFQGIYNFP